MLRAEEDEAPSEVGVSGRRIYEGVVGGEGAPEGIERGILARPHVAAELQESTTEGTARASDGAEPSAFTIG
jgi:hypothetical protein